MISLHKKFSIYFGDASASVLPAEYLNFSPEINLSAREPFASVASALCVEALMFLRQTHSSKGLIIRESEKIAELQPFLHEGDYLITAQRGLGIGVMTADCLPVVVYDARNDVIAIAHAGWKGAFGGVVESMLVAMQQEYGTQSNDLQAFFGPSANVCCYEVGSDFLQHLPAGALVDELIQKHDGRLFFDLPFFMQRKLMFLGVDKNMIQRDYNVCTICDVRWCSYRRDGSVAKRQMTVVSKSF